ncbi:MAG: hypothetical protein EOM20_09320 [Spartobacteria bacterium]|nr:hypothetical protein [Spartobacteria bacterium]
MRALKEMATSVYRFRYWVGAVVVLGLFLRVDQYVTNRSLWLDEIFLASNIIQRNMAELMKPLDYNQGAPVGFLWALRAMYVWLGRSEYALRLLSLLAGLASVPLFAALARRTLSHKAVLPAVFLFAISPSLVRYSAEVKQYGCDAFLTIVLLLLAWDLYRNPLTLKWAILLGVVGALSVWCSHPSVFLLAGIGATLGLFCLKERNGQGLMLVALFMAIWMVSFLYKYSLTCRSLVQNQFLTNYWRTGFMPFPPRSLKDLSWYMEAILNLMERPVEFTQAGLAATLAIIGAYAQMASKERRLIALTGIVPIGLALLASALHRYPFEGRLMLFSVPILLMLIAEGLAQIKRMPATILFIFLILHPLEYTVGNVILPRRHTEIRPVVEYLEANWQSGDKLYIYYHTVPMFIFYADPARFQTGDYIEGISSIDDWRSYAGDLACLKGHPRVWVMMSHIWRRSGVDEEKFFVYCLDSYGRQLDAFHEANAALYLYDLTQEPPDETEALF